MLRPSDRRRYSGATVNAVTCPCHSVPWPSALPMTFLGEACRVPSVSVVHVQSVCCIPGKMEVSQKKFEHKP